MASEAADELMQSAWATRRAALDAPGPERRRLFTEAKNALTRALALCREDGSPLPLAQALHLLANLEVDLGQRDAALGLWEEAVGVLRGTDDSLQLAHKVRHLGDLHRSCGRLDEAHGCYTEALGLYRQHAGPKSLDFANAVCRMAELTEQRGSAKEALELWRETRELYAAVDITAGVEQAKQQIERLERS